MITRHDMFDPLLAADPGFEPQWRAFDAYWRGKPEQPLYVVLSELARHLIAKLRAQDTQAFEAVFGVVERWLVEGDEYVRGAARIGLFEDLQNGNLHVSTNPSDFERWLKPESTQAWKRMRAFWGDKKEPPCHA
jgi:hypothetical protein